MRRVLAFALLLLSVVPVAAQTDTVVAGAVADSSIMAPVIVWSRVAADGDTLTAGENGWTVFAEAARRVAPRRRAAVSIAVTPLRAHSSDHVYAAGERLHDREFDDTSVEATAGRIDVLGERWTSDVRAVALYEHVRGVDRKTRDFWRGPYAGLRTRQSWRHITAEDPLLLTFEGSEVTGEAEVFAGRHIWSRVHVDQRFGRRFGRIRAAESATAFAGTSLDGVSAFLAGASWPVAGLIPLYGFRYGELRLERGASANGDLQFAISDRVAVNAHASALTSRGIAARGLGIDLSGSWNGMGLRFGIASPHQRGRTRNRVVVYGSFFAASFLR